MKPMPPNMPQKQMPPMQPTPSAPAPTMPMAQPKSMTQHLRAHEKMKNSRDSTGAY